MNQTDFVLGFQSCSPPVPSDADLRHFPNMPLEVARLRDSDIASVGDPEVFRCAVMLWCAAWHQVPAGSLPNDDATLARMAGLGRDIKTWKRLRVATLRGFREFADGRIYHRVVCEKAIESLNSTRLHDWNKACGRTRKDNFDRRKKQLPNLPAPERPAPAELNWPAEQTTERTFARCSGNGSDNAPNNVPRNVAGRVPERGKSPEGKGMDLSGRTPTEFSPEERSQTPSPVAAHAGQKGPAHDTSGLIVSLADKMRVHQ